MKPRLLLLCAWLALPGCQSFGLPEWSLPTIAMPRIGFSETPEPVLPVSVAYAFDASVTEARIETQACGLPHTLNTGEIIPQAFLEVGQQRFQSVSAYEGTGEAVRAAQSNDLTVQLGMVHHSFRDMDRMADEDNYLVLLDLKLHAVLFDRDGTELTQTPLHFSDELTVWTPALTGQSVSCATGQYEATIRSAARDLAGQLAGMVPALLANDSPPAPAAADRPAAPATAPSLMFRTRLKDANENLILEGGEIIVLDIEATYTGTRVLESAHADLSGSPVIVKAFSDVTALPVALGAFQPGETKTTEIRGRMPLTVREPTGELVISLTPGDGAPVVSHRILAPLRDGSAPPTAAAATDVPAAAITDVPVSATDAPATANPPAAREEARPPAEAYVAILVGMDAYRDDWPDAYRIPTGRMEDVEKALRATGTFTEKNIRVLEGGHAAKSDVEEALFAWGRQRIGEQSVLLVYFAGQALKNPASGEVYLAPYEGSPDASANRLIALRTLQRALGTLNNRLTLLLLDAPLIPLNNPASGPSGQSRPVRWDSGLPADPDNRRVIQIRAGAVGENDNPADVFAGLLSGTDTQRAVTVGEFLKNASQVGDVTPVLPDSSPLFGIPLAREAVTTDADTGKPMPATPEAPLPNAVDHDVATPEPAMPETPTPTEQPEPMQDTDSDAAEPERQPAAPSDTLPANAVEPDAATPETMIPETPAPAEQPEPAQNTADGGIESEHQTAAPSDALPVNAVEPDAATPEPAMPETPAPVGQPEPARDTNGAAAAAPEHQPESDKR